MPWGADGLDDREWAGGGGPRPHHHRGHGAAGRAAQPVGEGASAEMNSGLAVLALVRSTNQYDRAVTQSAHPLPCWASGGYQ